MQQQVPAAAPVGWRSLGGGQGEEEEEEEGWGVSAGPSKLVKISSPLQ